MTGIALLALLSLAGTAQTERQPVQAPPMSLPQAVIGEAYFQRLRPPQQGQPPWKWRQLSGRLPADITLRPDGVLAGTPAQAGEYRFRLEVTDSASPAAVVVMDAVLVVKNPLESGWQEGPVVRDNGIWGSLTVINSTSRVVDLTVIVVAVNETGRATALGYQHFAFSPGTQTIPFGSSLPRGRYVVHADVVAEIARTRTILRTRQQSQPIEVP